MMLSDCRDIYTQVGFVPRRALHGFLRGWRGNAFAKRTQGDLNPAYWSEPLMLVHPPVQPSIWPRYVLHAKVEPLYSGSIET